MRYYTSIKLVKSAIGYSKPSKASKNPHFGVFLFPMKISVITSTYREYETGELQRAIASVQTQTLEDWELIIIGDNTPCGNAIRALLEEIGDKRIVSENQLVCAGISSPGTIPKIKGVELSAGELAAFLDADNTYFPNHLDNCVNAFQSDPTLDLVYGNTKIIFNFQFASFKHFLSFTWHKPDWSAKRAKLFQRSNFLDMSEPVFTKKAYNDSGGLSPAYRASDWRLWLKMLKCGHNNFKHLNHNGITYYTSSLQHHLSYFALMIIQNSALPYTSLSLSFIVDRLLRKHHEKKHR